MRIMEVGEWGRKRNRKGRREKDLEW